MTDTTSDTAFETVSPETLGFSSRRLARVDDLARRYVDGGKLAGTVTLVARRGQVAHFEAHGQRNVEANKPMERDTLFRIYSMTKPVTTVAAMMLFEEGKVRLEDPVWKFIPAFGETKVFERAGVGGPELVKPQRPMTVRDLMRHTAGLSYGWFHDSPVEDLYRKAQPVAAGVTLSEMVDRLAELPLLYHPGSAWRYSLATDVLGRVVEVVAGESLDMVFAKRIFEPLGMDETGFFVSEENLDRFAAMYSPVEGYRFGANVTTTPENASLAPLDTPEQSPFRLPSAFLSGGGGLVSSTTDYLRFAQMLANGGEGNGTRLLGRKTLELMTMNHLPMNLLPIGIGVDEISGYGFGLGFSVLVNVAQAAALGSPGSYGWGGAATTSFWVDPVEELVGMFMTQFMPSSFYPVVQEFRNAVYGALVD